MKIKKIRYSVLISLILAFVLSLSSCSVITVNFDKIFPPSLGEYSGTETDTEGSDTPDADTSDTEADGGDEDGKVNIYEYTGSAISEKYLSEIGEYDFGGQSIFIKTTADSEAFSVISPSIEDGEEADTYSKAVYERNRIVEERFGCEFHYSVTTVEEMIADIKASIKNEAYYADLLALPQNELYKLVKEDYLYNLRSLPFLDRDAEYFNPYAWNSLSAGYHDYAVISYATIDPDDIGCVFINTEMTAADEMLALVDAGHFTWGQLLEITKWQSISFGGSLDIFPDTVYASAGLELVNNSKNKTPEVVLPEKAAGVRDVVTWLLKGWTLLPETEETNEETGETVRTGGLSAFLSGESVCHIGHLGDCDALAASSFEWAVAPMPKYHAEGDHLSYMPNDTLTLSVPINTTDHDGASVLLRALSAASYGYLRDAYSEYHMYNTVRSSAVLKYIEMCYDTPFFDFAHGLGACSDDIADCTYLLLREAAFDPEFKLEKQFNKLDGGANKALKKLYEPRN